MNRERSNRTARPNPRRLTMADLAILVAGSAAALLMWRFSRESLDLEAGSSSVFGIAYKIGVWPAPAILATAAALLLARTMKPRPRWRAVFRQPGTCASLAILAHLAIIAALMAWRAASLPPPGLSPYRPTYNTYLYANRLAGAWVSVAWATLFLAGAWRPEPSWIDRSGRLLGAVAILVWLWGNMVW